MQGLQLHVLKFWRASQRLLDVDCGGICLQDKAGQAKEESKGYLDSAKDKANQLFGQTQDKAGQAKGEAKDTLGSTADKASAKADEAHKEGKGELAMHSHAFSDDFTLDRQATVVFQMRSRTPWTPALTMPAPRPTWRAMVSE